MSGHRRSESSSVMVVRAAAVPVVVTKRAKLARAEADSLWRDGDGEGGIGGSSSKRARVSEVKDRRRLSWLNDFENYVPDKVLKSHKSKTVPLTVPVPFVEVLTGAKAAGRTGMVW